MPKSEEKIIGREHYRLILLINIAKNIYGQNIDKPNLVIYKSSKNQSKLGLLIVENQLM